MSWDIAPPLSKTERLAIAIMAAALALALALITTASEYAARRAARDWPPHATAERTAK